MLLHIWVCQEPVISCAWPHCGTMRGIVRHWDECSKLNCIPNCAESNETLEALINLWSNCADLNCQMCLLLKKVRSGKLYEVTR